jgi:serine phosphatase RsbU (regulator of sigma subunit)
VTDRQDAQLDPALAVALATCRPHPAPMAVLAGPEGMLYANRACLELLGENGSGESDAGRRRAGTRLLAALGGQHLAGPAAGRITVTAPGGASVPIGLSSAPIPSADGHPVGALLVLQAVTSTPADPDPVPPAGEAAGAASDPGTASSTAGGGQGVPESRHSAEDLADLSSLDVGTICGALGRLTVPSRARWAIIWLRSVDRMGRVRLDRRDVPATGRRRASGSSALADRLGVGRVLASGSPVTARVPAGHGLPGDGTVTVPLRDKRRVVGALTLGDPAVGTDDPGTLALADRAGVAIANASRFRIEHAVSRDLQRLLAPRSLPSVRGAEMAARLIAGAPGVMVGGDWYDAAELPDGRLAVTIGDVVGRGLRSAVEMTQLRTGLRNLALEGLEPAEVLAGADEFLRRTGEARFVTCLHLVFRPDTGQVDIANAGHLRPVYLPLGGRPRTVPIGTGLPLGGAADLARDRRHAAVGACRITLHPGESLLLFTDGLVESRTRSADEGVARMLQVLEQRGPAPASGVRSHLRRHRQARRPSGPGARELCDSVLSAMLDRDGERDDVAVLVLRRRQLR